ncbi:MAG: hypothetical protein AAGB15_00560 [Pseudomonadota bacterium]
MFQDDRMISFLSAIVIMVAIGTLVQRADGLSGIFGSDEPETALIADQLTVVPDTLTRIEVLANDVGLEDAEDGSLRIVSAPECGQVFVQGDVLQYLAEPACAGEQTWTYAVTIDGQAMIADVVATVTGGLPREPVQKQAPEVALPDALAAPGGPKITIEDETPAYAPRPAQDSGEGDATAPAALTEQAPLAGVLSSGGANPVSAAQPDPLVLKAPTEKPLPAADAAEVPSDATDLQTAALTEVPATPAPKTQALPAEETTNAPTVAALPQTEAPAPRMDIARESLSQQPATAAEVPRTPTEPQSAPETAQQQSQQVAAAASEPEVELTPVPRFDPTPPGTRLVSSALSGVTRAPDGSPVRRAAQAITATGAAAGAGQPTDFMVAVIPLSEPRAIAPVALGSGQVVDRLVPGLAEARLPDGTSGSSPADASDLDQKTSETAALGPALTDDLIDPAELPLVMEAPVPARAVPFPQARRTAALPSQGGGQGVDRAPTPAAPGNGGSSGGTTLAALRPAGLPCVTPPATTIDVGRAAQSTILIMAPCHANTVAELTYSGLRLAVPLDSDGNGTVTALGFEPNSPALVIFSTGEKIDFDLPFKGINKVSRVALVWDTPVALELNALEFGAQPGTAGHVRPENPKSFAAVRRGGGGFLSTYFAYGDIGQNAQFYTHFTRQGGQSGIVKLMIDFASRSRDKLEGTCGSGEYAAPQFLIMRSVSGRADRPVLKKLAAHACSDLSLENTDKRLISGGIADLVIAR